MKPTDKKKRIASNAAILIAGILASFILPMIGDSLTEGRSAFLRMLLHVFRPRNHRADALRKPNDGPQLAWRKARSTFRVQG